MRSRLRAVAFLGLLCGAPAACWTLIEEPVPPEVEFADVLTYEEAIATEANWRGVPPPVQDMEVEAFGPVYYPEPAEPGEVEGEGGAPASPVRDSDEDELVEPPTPQGVPADVPAPGTPQPNREPLGL